MERIRRSIRDSFRRRPKERSHRAASLVETATVVQPGGSGISGTSSKAELWLPDEAAVRDGTCSFNVKYLGGVEVFESRGMQICEGALKRLRVQRRRPVKAILYVSGDGLRVVDQENNRGLIVDQTIEKVSFCAPDRNHDKGFAYICRDGSSRRWMCHGFLATKESGERLSHAVGCAFAVCLEKKKKRDEEATLAAQAAADLLPSPAGDRASTSAGFTLRALPLTASPKNGLLSNSVDSNQKTKFDRNDQACSSFRHQLSMTERICDPQTAILQEKPPMSQVALSLRIAPKPRPASNPMLFERQGSLRAPQSSTESFRRQLSLRSYSSDHTGQFQSRFGSGNPRSNEPILESDEDTVWPQKSALSDANAPTMQRYNLPQINGSCLPKCGQSVTTFGINHESHAVSYSPAHTAEPVAITPSHSLNENTSAKHNHSLYPARSRADEWLEQTLKTSLSISSSISNADFATKTSLSDAASAGLLLGQPRPPLTPTSLTSPVVASSYEFSSFSKKTFDSDFSKYSLPPITESFPAADVASQVITKDSVGSAQIDLFGQPVFNPLSNSSITSVSEMNHMDGSLDNYLGMKAGDVDPFDVKWSEMVINSSPSFHQTPAKSTNPFFNELNAVKTQ